MTSESIVLVRLFSLSRSAVFSVSDSGSDKIRTLRIEADLINLALALALAITLLLLDMLYHISLACEIWQSYDVWKM